MGSRKRGGKRVVDTSFFFVRKSFDVPAKVSRVDSLSPRTDMETALRGRFDGAMRIYTGVGDKNIPSSCVVASIFRAIGTENQFTRVRRDRTQRNGCHRGKGA